MSPHSKLDITNERLPLISWVWKPLTNNWCIVLHAGCKLGHISSKRTLWKEAFSSFYPHYQRYQEMTSSIVNKSTILLTIGHHSTQSICPKCMTFSLLFLILMGKLRYYLWSYEILNFLKHFDFETFIMIFIDTMLNNFRVACIASMMPHASFLCQIFSKFI